MKKKVIIVLDVLLVFAIVVFIVLLTISNNIQSGLNTELQSVKGAVSAANADYLEKTKPNNISTPDEIKALKREIEENKQSTDKGQKEIKKVFFDYINTLYNSKDSLNGNKEKVIAALKPYIAPSLIESKIDKMFQIGSGNGQKQKANRSVKSDFCTLNDIYMTTEEYDDGSNLYIAVCEFHFSGLSQYHIITAANYNNKVLINSDILLSSDRDPSTRKTK